MSCLKFELFLYSEKTIFSYHFSSNGSKDHASYSHHFASIVVLWFMFASLLWNYCQMEIHPQMDLIKIIGAEATRSNNAIRLVDPQTSIVKENFCCLKFHVAGKVLGWYFTNCLIFVPIWNTRWLPLCRNFYGLFLGWSSIKCLKNSRLFWTNLRFS